MKKVRIYERGAAHILAIAVFVFILGAVGFVGYNAWQKQSTNAGSRPIVGTEVTYDAKKPSTYRYGANGLCRMYHTLHAKIVVSSGQKTVVEIMSNGSKILSVDTAKQRAGTRYFASAPFAGSFQDAAVKYTVKTPSTKTVTEKAKNGKKKKVTKTVWSESSSAVLVADLPRCIPTNDASEFNFHRTYSCKNNGEIVMGYQMEYDYAKKYGKASLSVLIDGKIVRTSYMASKDTGKTYYFRTPLKGKQYKLVFNYGKNKKTLESKKTADIKSCL